MSVSLILVLVMAVLYATGIYMLLERSMTRVLIGFLLIGNATNLLILVISGRAGVAPFYGETGPLADPLPQAFVLTSIVITFSVSAFLMALIYRSWRLANADVVQDDSEDVAVGRREVSAAAEPEVAGDDTEFGTRAAAAVSTALDLEEEERREEREHREEQERDAELERQHELRRLEKLAGTALEGTAPGESAQDERAPDEPVQDEPAQDEPDGQDRS